MKRYEVVFEIKVKESHSIWDVDCVQLKANDLFGAIIEASTVIDRLQKAYGEVYTLKSYVKERTDRIA